VKLIATGKRIAGDCLNTGIQTFQESTDLRIAETYRRSDQRKMDEEIKQVIFICTGNFYRSRLSEELFNYYVQQTDLPWEATSRGLVEAGGLRGISPFAFEYLDNKGLSPHVDPTRNPQQLKVADLEEANLLVALNRDEHEPMLRERFGQIPKILEQKSRLRFWNVCDIPGEQNSFSRFFGNKGARPTQSPESGTEHVDFAVKALIQEFVIADSKPTG
jgi:protein-tyrosine phosphatase